MPRGKASIRTASDPTAEIAALVEASIHDPLTFVLAMYPWREDGPLRDHDGPDVWQEGFLRELGQETARNGFDGVVAVPPVRRTVSSGHGIGKAQPVETTIPTPRGLRRFGDLVPGDEVFGADGRAATVSAVHERGRLPVYRVMFDDGASSLVCGDHLWTVKGRRQRRNKQEWITLSTLELLARGVTRANGARRCRQWQIPAQGPAAFVGGELPVAPYTLGVWLGDGGRRTGRITSADPDVIDRLRAVGETVTVVNGSSYGWTVRGLLPKLREMGLSDCYSYQKHVPVSYMEAPADVRREVLRGLLDTDGECSAQGAVVFNSTSRPLVDDVVWLARSLGWKARIQPTVKRPTYPGPSGEALTGRDCWRATLTVPTGELAFYVARKQARLRPVEARYLSRWIASIDLVGEADCRCITVNRPDGLYLTNDFIVTHNSTIVAWLVDWLMSTRPFCRGTVTANTFTQLETKTWASIQTWSKWLLNADWFVVASGRMYHRDHRESWFCAPQSSKEENSEAFAGQHAANSSSWYVFDEASAIPPKIWEVAEGGLTDGEPMIFCFGNPTRSNGKFHENTFGRMRDRWHPTIVDSRDSRLTNKAQIAEWVQDYGEDSDFVRVRVRGLPPAASDLQFIGLDLVSAAQTRPAFAFGDDPLVCGLDVARGGLDDCVFRFRRGFDARSIPPVRIPGEQARDSMRLVTVAADILGRSYDGRKVAMLFVDGTGIGGPIADRLKQMGHGNVTEVQFGAMAPDPKFANMRSFMWGKLREWLTKGAIDASAALEMDLTGPGYKHDKSDRLLLESKEEMKKRDLDSPDDADALALTFAAPVTARRQTSPTPVAPMAAPGAGWTLG